MTNNYTAAQQLRQILSGEDRFHISHQIIQERRIQRKIPDWTKNDKMIRDLLFRSFPRLDSNTTHRFRASRWARVIHLYYRIGLTYGQVAAEMSITPKAVADLLLRINRVSRGQRANGTGSFTTRKGKSVKVVR